MPTDERNKPILDETQSKFPWLPEGYRTPVPAGSPPWSVLQQGMYDPPVRWDEMPLLSPVSGYEWEGKVLDAIELGVFAGNPLTRLSFRINECPEWGWWRTEPDVTGEVSEGVSAGCQTQCVRLPAEWLGIDSECLTAYEGRIN